MKKKYLSVLLVALSCFSHPALTQTAPSIQWQKSLGGTDNDDAYYVQQTTDGGYIITGASASSDGNVTGNHGDYDAWVVKLNSSGTIQWQKSLGGTGDDEGFAIQQTTDGGYIVTGSSASNDGDVTGNHGDYDIWVVKLNSTGDIQWQKSLGGSDDDEAIIRLTTDGGYIVTGWSHSNDGNVTGNHGDYDVWVVKLNSNGTIQWQKSLGGTGDDEGYDVQQTTDGGYIITGESSSPDGDLTGNHGGYDIWVVKLNGSGVIQWQKNLGGSGDDIGYGVHQTPEGGYIITGTSSSNDGDVSGNHGDYDVWVAKLNSLGTIEWQKSLGGTSDDEGYGIKLTTDGGYIITGFSYSSDGDVTGNHGSSDAWISKLNSTGNIQWQKSLGGSEDDAGLLGVQQTADGGYVLSGFTYSNDGDVTGHHGTGNSDFWIVKLGTGSAPVTLFTFTGNGNWNDAANWSNNLIPTSPFAAGTQIVINPIPGGECILNVPVIISEGASLSIASGAKITINENLTLSN